MLPQYSSRPEATSGSHKTTKSQQVDLLISRPTTKHLDKSSASCCYTQPTTRVAVYLLLTGAAILLASSLAGADYAQPQAHHPHQHHQEAYNGLEQHQPTSGHSKSKKIQIVYIKVPLTKLKPSLANNDYSSAANNSANDARSQSNDQQNQMQQLSRQQSSFLIPMAVLQSDGESGWQPGGPNQTASALGAASSNSVAAHAHLADAPDWPQRRPTSQQAPRALQPSPMELYRELSGSVSHGINHGFMSSFLLGEKEKMTAAALRLHQLHQPAPSAPLSSSPTDPLASTPPTPAPTTPKPGPGGLMPDMMVPFSHMPDNMIGQAYNAAVGQALPLESGSPASLLSSSSDTNTDKRQQPYASNTNNGGTSGTPGEAGSSHGTASSISYGASGPNQPDSTLSGNGYQSSGSNYAGSGPSSGYGSGTNMFGASVALYDFPAASGQQAYGAQQPSSSSNSNSNSNTNSHQLTPSAEAYSNQKLRQAKKTIIPIVVQVEHAILENNDPSGAYPQQNSIPNQGPRSNKYTPQRGHRHLAGPKRARSNKPQDQYRANNHNNNNALHGASSNEISFGPIGMGGPSQYINAANAHDINQITAAINAENAANAAAALAQADMAFGNGAPAYTIPNQDARQQHHQARPSQQYAAGLQSAASALLANTHPVIQAAASGSLASVSKLGAKLGEIIALPSMQVPNSIASLPSALSSITNQMGVQIGQAVQQVAKEHPTAHAFARQVAQHAGINLAQFNPNTNQQQAQNQFNQHNTVQQNTNHQQQMAASNQHSQSMSPQAQLQNLKLSIGQNLQSAAAQIMAVHQKANAQPSLLGNPLAALYPQAVKQLSAMSGLNTAQSSVVPAFEPHFAQSSIVPVQQQLFGQQSQPQQQQGQISSHLQASDLQSPFSQVALLSEQSSKATGKGSLKSKFLSFFQPPKFISNLLSWNDRADDRNDHGIISDAKLTNNTELSKSPELKLTTLSANSSTSMVPEQSTSSTTVTQATTTTAASNSTTTTTTKKE